VDGISVGDFVKVGVCDGENDGVSVRDGEVDRLLVLDGVRVLLSDDTNDGVALASGAPRIYTPRP
jgi:hypothetical protein